MIRMYRIIRTLFVFASAILITAFSIKDGVSSNPYLLVFDGKDLILEGGGEFLDFGKVKKGSPSVLNIRVENHSTDQLIFSNIRGSCGLSIPSYPRRPVLPGDDAVIQVRYDSSRLGSINRNIIIHANTYSSVKILKVRGKIYNAE